MAKRMAITGGELRGRRLHVPKAGVRPTTGRVREAIFSMLGVLEGTRVLDLFCGSGALGIEALSRGASAATFVDRDVSAVSRNVEELGIDVRVERSDVVAWLRGQEDAAYGVVFCDPPYTLAADLDVDLGALISRVLGDKGRLVLETAARQPIDLTLPISREREYGDTLIRIYAHE